MILLYYMLIYRSTGLNTHMEIREILTLLESVESGVSEGSLNEVTQGVEHSEWADNVKDAYYPAIVKIIKKRTEDGRHIKSQAVANGKLVGQYNMNTGVGTFTNPKKQGVAEGSASELKLLIQQYEDRVEDVYGMVPGPRQRRAIADRDALEARIEALPGGKAALAKWARSYNDAMDESVSEGVKVVKSDYDLDQMVLTFDIEGPRPGYPLQFTYWDYDEDFANAERKDVFDQLQKQPWYAKLDHPTRMEILDAAYRAIRGLEPQEYRPTVDDEPMDVGDQLDEQQTEEDPVARVEQLARELQNR